MKIGIVGLGVMGGSFAARLRSLNHTVTGIDIDPDTLDFARENGIVDEADTDPSVLSDADLVILCLNPRSIVSWVRENQKYLKPDTLILEISGVKQALGDQLHENLREDIDLVSIHPMCGRESQGIIFSTPDIFDRANFLIIPHADNREDNLERVKEMARTLGCRSVSFMDPEVHDRMIAFLSQLTHVIAVSLMNTHDNEDIVEYSGDSFRELTRIARINEIMWSELFLLNRDLLLEEIDAFEASLNNFRSALQSEDRMEMERLFKESTRRRSAFDVHH